MVRVLPVPVAMASMWLTACAFFSLNTRTPVAGWSVLSSVTGTSSPSRANTVYDWASWNSEADRP